MLSTHGTSVGGDVSSNPLRFHPCVTTIRLSLPGSLSGHVPYVGCEGCVSIACLHGLKNVRLSSAASELVVLYAAGPKKSELTSAMNSKVKGLVRLSPERVAR